MITTPVCL